MNGMIHFHIVVFGTRWIMNENELVRKYRRLGFVDVQTLVNVRGKWRFKKKPKDYDERNRLTGDIKREGETNGGSPLYASPDVSTFHQIMRELKIPRSLRVLMTMIYLTWQLQHWALNTRFWTNSKDLQLPKEQKESSGFMSFLQVFTKRKSKQFLNR